MAATDPLRRYLVTQRSVDRELARTLERAARDARAQIRRLPKGDIRRAQLERVVNQIKRAQRAMWTEATLGIVQNGRGDAIEAAQKSADALTALLYRKLPERQAREVERSLNATAREGIEAVKARVPRELSAAVVGNGRLAQRRMDEMIRSALTRGLSAEEFAREVYRHISPTVPGGASYAAMRLARTEINNAFHQQQIANGTRPGVTGIKWNLSGSHTVPDECNRLDGKVFPPDKVPPKPHPQCLCYLTYEMDSLDDFLEQIQNGDFDDLLDEPAVVALEAHPSTENTKIDHSGHNHPATPKARGACRAHGGTTAKGWPPREDEESPKPEPKKRAPAKKAAPKVEEPPKAKKGKTAAERDADPNDEWLNDNLNPITRGAAREAYDACNERAPNTAARRIRSVSEFNRRTTPDRFHASMDRGAFAACSAGHIVAQPTLHTQGYRVRRSRENGWFIGHRVNDIDGVLTTMAHEMGHALTVGYTNRDEDNEIFDAIADTFGWDHMGESLRSLQSTEVKWKRFVQDNSIRRRKFEQKFGKYAATSYLEFMAEIWSVYSLDPDKCDPDVKRIGELLNRIIEDVIDLDELERQIKERLERERSK